MKQSGCFVILIATSCFYIYLSILFESKRVLIFVIFLFSFLLILFSYIVFVSVLIPK